VTFLADAPFNAIMVDVKTIIIRNMVTANILDCFLQ